MPMPTFPLARLGAFRAELHACYTRRADALFELGDALLSAQAVPSLPHLSLEPVHQRGWGSTYAALARGRIDTDRLRDLLASSLPDADPLVFAVDVTTWPRCDAECSPQRGYYYHPSRHSAGQPIIAGWAWQWICQLGFDRDSWTAPVDARRLHPLEDTDQTTAGQIRALVGRLDAGGRVPLFVFATAATTLPSSPSTSPTCPWAVLVRLRSDAVSTPTHHHAHPAQAAVHAAMAPSSTAATRPPGPPRPPKPNGRRRSYELVPGSDGAPDGTYSTADIWVVRYDGTQDGSHVTCNDSVLSDQYESGQGVDGQDVVVWYCLRGHHVPRLAGEEARVVPYEFHGFHLEPRDFLDDTPIHLYPTSPSSPL